MKGERGTGNGERGIISLDFTLALSQKTQHRPSGNSYFSHTFQDGFDNMN